MTANAGSQSLSGIEMSDDEIDQFLYEQGHGILSLATSGDVYSVPISFGYDEAALYMSLLEFGNDSRKIAYMETTDVACLTTYDVTTRFDWKSVVVRGEIHAVPDDDIEYMDDVLDDNAWFPTIFPPSDPMTDVHHVTLSPEHTSGRKGQAYQE